MRSISGILFPDIAAAVAWGRLTQPLWLRTGFAVWPFVRVAARGMVTVTHFACCQGAVPHGSVIRYRVGLEISPTIEHVAIKFGMSAEEATDVPFALARFSYIGLSVHLRYLDLRYKRRKKPPSMFDGI